MDVGIAATNLRPSHWVRHFNRIILDCSFDIVCSRDGWLFYATPKERTVLEPSTRLAVREVNATKVHHNDKNCDEHYDECDNAAFDHSPIFFVFKV